MTKAVVVVSYVEFSYFSFHFLMPWLTGRGEDRAEDAGGLGVAITRGAGEDSSLALLQKSFCITCGLPKSGSPLAVRSLPSAERRC